jgi:AcrR family transcriptional regulator
LKSKRAYHHGNLREALIAAGLKELARSGPGAFSLREVARRVGVAPTAVYRHFAAKDDLLAAIAGECADRIAITMQEAVASAPADDPLERFRATGIAYVRFAVAHPEHFRVLGIPGLLERVPPDKLAEHQAWQAAEREVLARAQAHDQFSLVPLDEALLAASALVHGLAMMIVEGRLGEVDEARATELAIVATRALGVGFLPRNEAWTDPRGRVRVPAQAKPSKRR